MAFPRWGKGTADPAERSFLSGPQPRSSGLGFAFDVFRELVRGFRVLHFVGPCVTVFGSARFEPGHVERFLPDTAASAALTVEQLLSHSSGLLDIRRA